MPPCKERMMTQKQEEQHQRSRCEKKWKGSWPMTWKVEYSDEARGNLRDIFRYISDTLLEPLTAKAQIGRIQDAAEGLDHLPFRHRLCDVEPWHSLGLRVFPVDNYLIFYLPDETRDAVIIYRIIYGGRDLMYTTVNP